MRNNGKTKPPTINGEIANIRQRMVYEYETQAETIDDLNRALTFWRIAFLVSLLVIIGFWALN